MNSGKFFQNPRTRGKSHHYFWLIVLYLWTTFVLGIVSLSKADVSWARFHVVSICLVQQQHRPHLFKRLWNDRRVCPRLTMTGGCLIGKTGTSDETKINWVDLHAFFFLTKAVVKTKTCVTLKERERERVNTCCSSAKTSRKIDQLIELTNVLTQIISVHSRKKNKKTEHFLRSLRLHRPC